MTAACVGSTLEDVEVSTSWEPMLTTLAEGFRRSAGVGGYLGTVAASRSLARSFEAPRAVVEHGFGQTTTTIVTPIVLQGQLVSRAQVDFYERAVALPVAQLAAWLTRSIERAASGRSSMRRIRRSTAYRGLLDLNQVGIVIALRRLSGTQRPLWLAFLQDAVADRPAEGSQTIDEAASAWRAWGRRNQLLV